MGNMTAIAGRLGKDAEVRYAQNGDAVVEFSLADDVGYGDKKSTNWWRCQAWKKDKLAPYLTKGANVTVFGEVTLREWEDREGNRRISHDVRVNDVVLQGGKKEEGHRDGAQNAPGQRQAPQGGHGQGAGRQGAPRGGYGQRGGQDQAGFPTDVGGLEDVPF